MNEVLIFLGILVLFVAFVIYKGIVIVPQGFNYVVEYFGRYNKTLKPGLNLIIPFVQKVSFKVTTKDIVLDIPGQEVITKDNAVIIANAVSFISINEPSKAVYGVTNYEVALKNLVQTTLRSIIGEMELDDALSSREQIKTKLKEGISDDIVDWGLTLKNVEIQDIKPSSSMQDSMEEQAAAVRSKRAAITTAEGEKQAAITTAEGAKRAQILEAEGRMAAAEKDAAAQITLSESASTALKNIANGVGDKQLPAMYILGEKYIGALEKLSETENGKFVVMPSDITSSLAGLLGGSKMMNGDK